MENVLANERAVGVVGEADRALLVGVGHWNGLSGLYGLWHMLRDLAGPAPQDEWLEVRAVDVARGQKLGGKLAVLDAEVQRGLDEGVVGYVVERAADAVEFCADHVGDEIQGHDVECVQARWRSLLGVGDEHAHGGAFWQRVLEAGVVDRHICWRAIEFKRHENLCAIKQGEDFVFREVIAYWEPAGPQAAGFLVF